MYLSRIELDTSRRETVRALGSPYIFHAALENCFDGPGKDLARKLWRIDQIGERLYLLILSREKPDFTGLAKQFCRSDIQSESKLYDSLLSRLKEGQHWHFRLCANPAHSVKTGASPSGRGKVYAHVTIEQQRQWLFQRAESYGFAFAATGQGNGEYSFDVVQSETLRFNRQGKYVTLGVAVFEGILLVNDAVLFAKTLTEGIGRAKAFGCGLLTIAGIS